MAFDKYDQSLHPNWPQDRAMSGVRFRAHHETPKVISQPAMRKTR